MSWFLFSLISMLGWGFADLFYKKGTDEEDRYSHLKIAVWVGLVMGVCALILIPFSETLTQGGFSLNNLALLSVRYLPASLSYIISMVIGYAGLRYLELSVCSPVQNASGGLSAVCMLLWFLLTGQISSVFEEYSWLDLSGTVLIVAGVIALAIAEKKLTDSQDGLKNISEGKNKYRFGALALLFPILYCLFDTVGTAADGILLSEENGMDLGEIDILVLYGLTFLLAGICAWAFLLFRQKRPYNPFTRGEIAGKGIAAVCEEFGQIFYVYAMAKNPVIAAPMIASYCIVSVLLSRLLLKENIGTKRYLCIFTVILGILLLGISEGIANI